MKLICENSNSSHINANGVRGDAADTIGQLDTLLPLCTLACTHLILIVIIITPSLACQTDTKVCKCKLISLACESVRLRGGTVPASCNWSFHNISFLSCHVHCELNYVLMLVVGFMREKIRNSEQVWDGTEQRWLQIVVTAIRQLWPLAMQWEWHAVMYI